MLNSTPYWLPLSSSNSNYWENTQHEPINSLHHQGPEFLLDLSVNWPGNTLGHNYKLQHGAQSSLAGHTNMKNSRQQRILPISTTQLSQVNSDGHNITIGTKLVALLHPVWLQKRFQHLSLPNPFINYKNKHKITNMHWLRDGWCLSTELLTSQASTGLPCKDIKDRWSIEQGRWWHTLQSLSHQYDCFSSTSFPIPTKPNLQGGLLYLFK